MNALILLIIAQLLCLCYGHLNEPEFGRHKIDEVDPRRNRLLVVDDTTKRRRTKQAKQSKADERYETESPSFDLLHPFSFHLTVLIFFCVAISRAISNFEMQ